MRRLSCVKRKIYISLGPLRKFLYIYVNQEKSEKSNEVDPVRMWLGLKEEFISRTTTTTTKNNSN